MNYTVTNPHGLPFTFGDIKLGLGENKLTDVPADVLQSMADAGMRVERTDKAPTKALEPVVTEPATPAPIPPARAKTDAPPAPSLQKKPLGE
jgi:hypothetical protein